VEPALITDNAAAATAGSALSGYRRLASLMLSPFVEMRRNEGFINKWLGHSPLNP
jgi:hypothetical protein